MKPEDVRSLEDFRRLPLLQRRTYQERWGDIRARQLPPGCTLAGSGHTSGTTGVPVEVLKTDAVERWWLAFYLRDLRWCDVRPKGRLAVIRPFARPGDSPPELRRGAALPYWDRRLHDLMHTGPAFAMDLHEDPRRQVDWLRQVAPDYLLTYPSNLEVLAGHVAESGQPVPGLRVIQAIAETLGDDSRQRIEAAFGVPVRNTYSCCEAGYLASPCPDGHGLHVHAENVLMEILNDDDEPCTPGQTGRVVLTALHNFASPLIRYDIGDEATVGPRHCPCGRGLPLLTRVLGKRRPLMTLPDGRRKNTTWLCRGLQDLSGYHQFQIEQSAADRVVVRVVPARDWTRDHAGRIEAMVRTFFEPCPVRVEVETRDRIEPAASGKVRDIIVPG